MNKMPVLPALVACCRSSFSGEAQDKPNIIVILTDDLGYGDVSCYPHLYDIKTPNIDRIASSGVRMTQAYSSAPVCGPTRASLLTGRFPQQVGVYGNYDAPNPGAGPFRNTFPPLLQQAGYRTAWFGKWHLGWDVSNHPLNNGFDTAFGFLGGMHDYFDPAKGDHYTGGPFAPHAFIFDGFKPVREMKYFTDELSTRAVQFIRESKEQPFFIYLAYSAPHTPIQAPDEKIIKYLRDGSSPVDAARLAMLDVLDEGVGRVLDVLEETGLNRKTLVVFTSDNGAEKQIYNGGLRGTKMTAWEGATRVPLIASWPGVVLAGTTSDTVCTTPDITATVLSAAGVQADPLVLDGTDLRPFWTGERSGNAHEGLVWAIEIDGPEGTKPALDNLDLLAVRLGSWKLAYDRKRKVDALYNLETDPGEQMDLSASHPEKKTELARYAKEFFKSCPPSCGRTANRDTRKGGDALMAAALREQCARLLEASREKPADRTPGITPAQ